MKIIDIDEFAAIAYERPLTDMFVVVESVSDTPIAQWASLEGGPIIICFDDICTILRQPIGCCHVEFLQSHLEESAEVLSSEYPDLEISYMRIFETACFRKDLNDFPPGIVRITQFQDRQTMHVVGIVADLSTGGAFGVDALSYGGLVWFLDGQTAIFRRECVDDKRIERLVPKR